MGRPPKDKELDEETPRKRGRPRKEESERIHRFDIHQETKNSVWAIASFSFAILSFLSFVGKAGRAGQIFNTLAHSLFGWGFFIIPLAFIFLGLSFVKSLSRKVYTNAVFGTALFVMTFLAIFYIFGNGDTHARVIQGGYLGVILGYPLLASVGFTASTIILFTFALIAILVSLNISIGSFFAPASEKPMESVVVKNGNEVVPIKPDFKPAVTPIAKPAKVEPMSDKEFVIKNLKHGKWTLPPIDLLNEDSEEAVTGDINANATIIKRTLQNFGIDVEMGEVAIGPTVTQFTLRPAVGVKLSRISTLNQDLALALAAHPIRIEAPIPGKSLVGIEIPNKAAALVRLGSMMSYPEFHKSPVGFILGRDRKSVV